MRPAVLAGVQAGVVAAGCVLLFAWLHPLEYGYPLALLPLLAAGPLAVRGETLALPRATLRGAIAGAVAAILAVAALLLAGTWWATFTGPASMWPVPTLPRPAVLPWLSWAQHYLLVVPMVAGALLAAGYAALVAPERNVLTWVAELLDRQQFSVRTKLLAALLSLAVLAMGIGWVAFNALEDMHLRGHVVQWQNHWLSHVGTLGTHLEELEAALVSEPVDEERLLGAEAAIQQTIDHLRAAPFHNGIFVGASTRRSSAEAYGPLLGRLEEAVRSAVASQERPLAERRGQTVAAWSAKDQLDRAVLADTVRLVDETDLAHHGNLFAILALLVFVAMAAFLLGQLVSQGMIKPLGRIEQQLERVAAGDFEARVHVANRDELGRLAATLNRVTVKLARLYHAERAGREAAEALAQREHELAAMKEFFTHTIVHDLKGPIATLSGYAELLQGGQLGPLTEAQRAAAEDMRAASKRLLGLVGDINDVFRLQQAALPFHPTAVEPGALLLAAAAEASLPGARPPEVRTHRELPAVYADRDLMLRVLGNLIGNAYKHAGPQARVVLSAELSQGQGPPSSRQAGDGEVTDALPRRWGLADLVNGKGVSRGAPAVGVRFAVTDDGPGIPPAERERIFDRFVQGGGSRGGAGLGLTFCRLVVEQQGGRIWVEEAPGGGTRVCFTLPALTSRHPRQPAAGPGHTAAASSLPNGTGR